MSCSRRRFLSLAAVFSSISAQRSHAAARTLEGFTVEESISVAGVRLVLNGVGVRKRAYFKTEMGALYLTQQEHSFDGALNAAGPKRIHLILLKDVTPDQASRLFLSDFKLSSTEDEQRTLLDEVRRMGEVYANLQKLRRGDVVDVDWAPGSGMTAQLNGQAMLDRPINNERFFKVVLRNYIGFGAPREYRAALLGVDAATLTDRPS